MKLTGNTIFITGGGSGIGRALAEALHQRGNKVIISGRRKANLAATIEANPGMDSIELDIADPASIRRVSAELISRYPKLNVLINNAGIMQVDDVAGYVDDELISSTITTNLIGPIRLYRLPYRAPEEAGISRGVECLLCSGLRTDGDGSGVLLD